MASLAGARRGSPATGRRCGLPGTAASIHCTIVLASASGSYGLPGTAASIHSVENMSVVVPGYGLPGTAASIHLASGPATPGSAMACREPRLRYTRNAVVQVAPAAMACREPRLRYTPPCHWPSASWLWLAGNRGFDTLSGHRPLMTFSYGLPGTAASIH